MFTNFFALSLNGEKSENLVLDPDADPYHHRDDAENNTTVAFAGSNISFTKKKLLSYCYC